MARYQVTHFSLLSVLAMVSLMLVFGADNQNAGAQKEPALTGRQIMEIQKKRHHTETEVIFETMLLIDKKGNERKRRVKTFSKEVETDRSKSLVVFLEPASVKGTALLTWENIDREDDQWLYLPSLKKINRVAEGSKKSYFMGTDLTFEDMETESLGEYNYTLLGLEETDGHQCYVIEAVPKSEKKLKTSAYSKRKLWVRKDIYFTLKAEYFDHRGRYIKTMTNEELYNIQGEIWRSRRSLVDNRRRKHKTLVLIEKAEINVPLKHSFFTERHILRHKHIQ